MLAPYLNVISLRPIPKDYRAEREEKASSMKRKLRIELSLERKLLLKNPHTQKKKEKEIKTFRMRFCVILQLTMVSSLNASFTGGKTLGNNGENLYEKKL